MDDFWSGSLAAIAGGITTVANMTDPVPDGEARRRPGAAIAREMAGAAPRPRSTGSSTRCWLRPRRAGPRARSPPSPRTGTPSVKVFLSDPDFAADEAALLATASAAAGRPAR